jgi:hypothetical protein
MFKRIFNLYGDIWRSAHGKKSNLDFCDFSPTLKNEIDYPKRLSKY